MLGHGKGWLKPGAGSAKTKSLKKPCRSSESSDSDSPSKTRKKKKYEKNKNSEILKDCITSSVILGFDPLRNPTLAEIKNAKSGSGDDIQDLVKVVCFEGGHKHKDLPIFTNAPGSIRLNPKGKPPVTRRDYPNIPGCFVLDNVLTKEECQDLIWMSEHMGYTEDSTGGSGRSVQQNENCVWVVWPSMNNEIFARCQPYLPPEVQGRAVAGLNRRWRLYKYNPKDTFRIHSDASYPGSGLDSEGHLVDDVFGDRWSELTWLVYLNSDFDGGPTRFFIPTEDACGENVVNISGSPHRIETVEAKQGSVACWFHGEQLWNFEHEGGSVSAGTKYVARSDVLYYSNYSKNLDNNGNMKDFVESLQTQDPKIHDALFKYFPGIDPEALKKLPAVDPAELVKGGDNPLAFMHSVHRLVTQSKIKESNANPNSSDPLCSQCVDFHGLRHTSRELQSSKLELHAPDMVATADHVEYIIPSVFALAVFMLALIGLKKFRRLNRLQKHLIAI